MDSGATWVAFHPKSFEHIEECQRQLDRCRFDVERLAAKINAIAARVHVVFNNNYEDLGQRNARVLSEIVSPTR